MEVLVCPYCLTDLKDQITPCCGEIGHGVLVMSDVHEQETNRALPEAE